MKSETNPVAIEDYSFGIIPVIQKEGVWNFLIVHQNTGNWSFPKGHQEENETVLDTVKRELWEETGITDCVIHEDITFSNDYQFEKDDKTYHKTNTYYLGFPSSDEITVPEIWQHEIIACKWCEYDEAKALLKFESMVGVLDDVVNALKSLD